MANLRDSHASSEVSPRTPDSTCCQARSAKFCDTPARSTKSVSDVDVELERHRKFVFHQASRDEDALRIAEIEVAMANRVVAERNVVAVGNHRLFALGHGERHEVVRLAAERGGHRHGHRRDHALEVVVGNGNLARAGVADAIWRL